MLQQRGLAVAGVAAQHDQPDAATPHVVIQRLFERRLDVSPLGEIAVETACLPVSVPRTRIRLQQRPQPRDGLLAPFDRRTVGGASTGAGIRRGRRQRLVRQRRIARGGQLRRPERLQRLLRRPEPPAWVRVRRPVEKLGDDRMLRAIDSLPVQAALLDQIGSVSERLVLEEHVEETGRQRVEVVRRRRRPAGDGRRGAVERGAGSAFRYADLANEIVVGQHEVAAGHDHVARADVAVHQPVAVQHVERLAHRPQPPDGQSLSGFLALLLGQQWEDTREVAQRRAVDPGHERGECILAPFPRDLEDPGDRLMLQMGARQTVGAHGSAPGFLVVGDLGDVRSEILLRRAIDLDDLERHTDAARTQASHDPIVPAVERHDLIFGPEPRRRRFGRRRRLAQQPAERGLQVLQAAARRRVVGQSALDLGHRAPAHLVVPFSEQTGQRCAERIHVRPRRRRGPAARAHLRSGLAVPPTGGGAGARDTDLRRDLRPLETGEDRRIVVADENGARAEIAVRHRRIVRGRAVQLPQCVNCASREGETRRRRPPCVRRSLLDRWRGRIDHGEEVHLSVITRGVLERIENAGGPVVQLQPAQRLELAARLVLVRIVARGKVVQMQDHLVLPGGVNAGIDAVEPLLLRAPQLQVDVPCEPAQRTVEGDDALRLQEAAQPRHLRRA